MTARSGGGAACLCLLVGGLASLPADGQGLAPSTLSTRASGPVTRRGQIHDTARLTVAAYATGTISFGVYGPDDPGCAGRPAASSTRAVSGGGTYASAPYVVPRAGVYRFVARYTGDARNAAAASACGDAGEAVTVTDPPAAVLGRSFQVGPLSGRIYVRAAAASRAGAAAAAPVPAAKGVGFVALVESRTLPVGSVVDARGGVARVTTAARVGVQVGDFGAGAFRVLQSRRERGLARLDLAVGRAAIRSCTPAKAAHAAAARRLSRRVLAELRASASGAFSTRGRFSAATVRGTAWDTVDRCDGTLTRVRRGVVLVTDFRRAQTIAVRAGRSYLARAP